MSDPLNDLAEASAISSGKRRRAPDYYALYIFGSIATGFALLVILAAILLGSISAWRYFTAKVEPLQHLDGTTTVLSDGRLLMDYAKFYGEQNGAIEGFATAIGLFAAGLFLMLMAHACNAIRDIARNTFR